MEHQLTSEGILTLNTLPLTVDLIVDLQERYLHVQHLFILHLEIVEKSLCPLLVILNPKRRRTEGLMGESLMEGLL